MSIKIGHASYDENSRASGGTAGDQTSKEVCIRGWYSSPWDVVLRPKTASLAEKSAKACEAACANPRIGYDQGSRNTLYIYAKLKDFDLAKITDACECDCSTLMHVCAIAGGASLTYGTNGCWTGNMVDAFVKSGDYKKLTAAKYLTSDAYLKRGDILVNTKAHTAMVLENGAKVRGSATTSKVVEVVRVNVSIRQLREGSTGENVKALQLLLNGNGESCGDVDGDFGDKTRRAVVRFQEKRGLTQDGIVGEHTWHALLK